jgi:hypothetical protein
VGEIRKACSVWLDNPKGKDDFNGLSHGWKMIIKLMFKREGGMAWIHFAHDMN